MEVWYANIFGKSVRVKRLPYLNKFLNNKKANKTESLVNMVLRQLIERQLIQGHLIETILDRNDT